MGKRRKSGNGRSAKRRKKAMPVVIMKRRRKVTPSRTMIAKTCVRTLTYVENFAIDAAAGVVAYKNYSANGLFKPNNSGSGHQPLGFDQMMELYNSYTCLSSAITATFMFPPTTVASGSAATCGVRIGDSSGTSPTGLGHLIELRKCKYKIVGYNQNPHAVRTVRYGMKPWKWLGHNNAKSDTALFGDAASNPSAVVDYEVFVSPFDENTNISSVIIQVRLSYKALFFEPETELVQS